MLFNVVVVPLLRLVASRMENSYRLNSERADFIFKRVILDLSYNADRTAYVTFTRVFFLSNK